MTPYKLVYTVPAATRLEAITNAVAMLRTGVTLLAVLHATATAGPYWDVALRVQDDDAPDPSWITDNAGYVVAPLENRGTLDAG